MINEKVREAAHHMHKHKDHYNLIDRTTPITKFHMENIMDPEGTSWYKLVLLEESKYITDIAEIAMKRVNYNMAKSPYWYGTLLFKIELEG